MVKPLQSKKVNEGRLIGKWRDISGKWQLLRMNDLKKTA
jgi:hypothetical protein